MKASFIAADDLIGGTGPTTCAPVVSGDVLSQRYNLCPSKQTLGSGCYRSGVRPSNLSSSLRANTMPG